MTTWSKLLADFHAEMDRLEGVTAVHHASPPCTTRHRPKRRYVKRASKDIHPEEPDCGPAPVEVQEAFSKAQAEQIDRQLVAGAISVPREPVADQPMSRVDRLKESLRRVQTRVAKEA